MQPVIVITHAAFDEARRLALRELLSQLRVEAPDLPVLVAHDEERKGSLWCWRVAVGKGLAVDATHVVWLPDDAIVCRDFGAILRACIAARPDDVFDCFVNHPALRRGEVPTCWYSTTDGYTGMGGVMPAKLLREHLEWRAARPELGDYPNDAGLNLWAADTGRLIYKTAWSLVQHNDELPSLDGHDDQAAQGHERRGLRWVDDARGASKFDVGNFLGRTFAAPEAHMPGFRTSCTDLGRTYAGNVFDLVRRIRPERWNVDAMYSACEPPPKDCPRVVILVPTYHEDVEIGKRSVPAARRGRSRGARLRGHHRDPAE